MPFRRHRAERVAAQSVDRLPVDVPARYARLRRGGPRTPLPLVPLIAIGAGIGIAYVSQSAHATQATYQASNLASQQQQLRGQAQLRALRGIMDEVYRLFDRRCRTDTALAKLARLRQRVRRFRSLGKTLDQLHSPNLEKALTFLDDKLLPATSNAVALSQASPRDRDVVISAISAIDIQ